MVAFEFFSRCVACISYIDIPRVVAIAEDLSEGGGGAPPATGLYVSLAVWFWISPIPMILFSSLFISMTRMLACGGNFLCEISLGEP